MQFNRLLAIKTNLLHLLQGNSQLQWEIIMHGTDMIGHEPEWLASQ